MSALSASIRMLSNIIIYFVFIYSFPQKYYHNVVGKTAQFDHLAN
jgi:hypothetical protein